MSRHRALIAAAVAAALSLVLPPGAGANRGGGDEYEAYVLGTLRWTRSLPAAHLKHSSPAIVDINGDGSNDVVVGGLDGRVYAFDANGNNLPGWPATATGAVSSSPAVGDLNGDGFNEVAVGTGSLEVAGTARRGAINIFNRNGTLRCSLASALDHEESAVFNAPAIGDVNGDGLKDVVYTSFDHRIRVVDHNCSQLGFYDHADSIFSAPALRDIDNNGTQEIFFGGDATLGPVGQSHNGGTFRALRFQAGANSAIQQNLAQIWSREDSLETFQSAAAIGNIDGDPGLEVVTGAGSNYCRFQSICTHSNRVWAFNIENGSDVAGWPKTVNLNTTFISAPALGDVDGDGLTDVVVGSNQFNNTGPSGGVPAGGAVEVFYGDGGPKARFVSGDVEILASPVIADVNGGGVPEVLIGDSGQFFSLNANVTDGTLDVLESGIAPGVAHKSSAAVGELGPGGWAFVAVGFNPNQNNLGVVHAYDIPVPASLPWPMHRKNPRRLGGDPSEPGQNCTQGYWMVGRDGAVFPFGNVTFAGSPAGPLNQPIVGMDASPSGNGYWLGATDGGVFAFGDAPFKGSKGGTPLNQPIVGIAGTPSGQGYWLVARDGGIFTFGDAPFKGSKGGQPLNQPIVGMEATPSGQGYWMVAADGGIFTFGDAPFKGSKGGIPLNQPIVGMEATPSGQGYWMVARDGGIFTFGDAPFKGSKGGQPLNQPIVGMAVTPSGQGYWFDAADGGIFSFGDAQFCGSKGGQALNAPIAGMASP